MRVFARRGLGAARHAEIAKEAGVSVPAVFFYFPTREELVTAVFASAQHHPGIAAGDAIGANITMLTIVLGLAALIRPFRTSARVVSYSVIAAGAGIAAAE